MDNLALMLSIVPFICGLITMAQLTYDAVCDSVQLKKYNELQDSVEDPEILTISDYALADVLVTSRLYDRYTYNTEMKQAIRERIDTMLWAGLLPILNFALLTFMLAAGTVYPAVGVIGLNLGVLANAWCLLFTYNFNHNMRCTDREDLIEYVKYATIATLVLIGVIIALALIIMFASYLVRTSHRYIFNILGGQ